MTEHDWLRADEPQKMLEWLRDAGVASDRKLRLFAIACCRRVWPWLTDPRSRRAVEVAEQFVDTGRRTDPARYFRMYLQVLRAWERAGADWLLVLADPLRWATEYSTWAATTVTPSTRAAGERQAQADLLRDLFGSNLFRAIALAPACRTPRVIEVAQRVYEERQLPSGTLDTALLSTLADALEDAGCADVDVLGHLREQGSVHVRGCWPLDAALAKE